jgi:hypothetical protein
MTKSEPIQDAQQRVREILENLSEDEQKLLSAVIAAERDKLYMQKPRGINEDLWRALTEIVR